MYLRNDSRPQGSRLALRVAVLGGVAVALFAVLFFRLWNLQVLSGDEYLAEAKNNRTREFKVIAPRGDILDRDGNVLVDNRTSLALQLNTQKLPEDPAEERAELTRLGELAHMSLRKVRRTIAEGEEVAAGAPVTLRQDVGYDLVYYLEENQRDFPGVTVQRVFVRHYPDGTRAAHVLGSVGEVTEEELKEPRYKQLEPGDEVGKAGVEYTYDKLPARRAGADPDPGQRARPADPRRPAGLDAADPRRQPEADDRPDVQAAGEAALAARGLPGAFVSMNIHNGQILGDRLQSHLRPDGLHRTDDPGPGERTVPRPSAGAADRPRDRRRLPDRLDLQDHHRPGGARKRRDHARRRRSTTTARSTSATETFENAGGAAYGAARPGPGAAGLLRRLLLRTRPRHVEDQRAAGMGAQAGDRPADRARPARRKAKAWCRASSGATSSTRKAKPNGPGRPATTSSWRPARATCRPTRCRWRSPTPRSATAARSSPRTWAWKSRTRPAGC